MKDLKKAQEKNKELTKKYKKKESKLKSALKDAKSKSKRLESAHKRIHRELAEHAWHDEFHGHHEGPQGPQMMMSPAGRYLYWEHTVSRKVSKWASPCYWQSKKSENLFERD